MVETSTDKEIEKYPEEVQAMYDDALVKGKDDVLYDIMLTVADNINETKDDVSVEIQFNKE